MLVLSAAPLLSMVCNVFDGTDAAADGKRSMKHWSAARSMNIEHAGAGRGRWRVMSKKTISSAPCSIVADSEFDRVADVAQFAGFGFAELDTAGETLPSWTFETRNNTFCEHVNQGR